MTNKAFEKWAIDYGLDYEPSFTRDDVEASWQAARADSEQEIAELKAYKNGQAKLIHQQNAHINDLREALERINHAAKGIAMSYIHKQCKEALLKTPAQSLLQHDNEVIEQVVTILKDSAWGDGIIDMRVDDLIEDVRALKG